MAEHLLSQTVTEVRGIAPEPSGKVAVFGTLGLGRPAVVRLLPNGALDTSFGDGGVDLLPIGGLYKHQVRALARAVGVPQAIVERPPTAGLWPGQTDEGEMGISYDDLDAVLAALEAGDVGHLDASLVGRVRAMQARSEHKRRMPPICPVEWPEALG